MRARVAVYFFLTRCPNCLGANTLNLGYSLSIVMLSGYITSIVQYLAKDDV